MANRILVYLILSTRLYRREWFGVVAEGAGRERLITLLGRARAKLGMFEGNMEDGEL